MRDREGQEHPDNAPVTWRELVWFFDREMAHRDRLATQRARDIKEARELRERQMLFSHRVIIALIMLIGIVLQWLAARH